MHARPAGLERAEAVELAGAAQQLEVQHVAGGVGLAGVVPHETAAVVARRDDGERVQDLDVDDLVGELVAGQEPVRLTA